MTLIGPNGLFLFNALSCALLALSARYALKLSRQSMAESGNALKP
jgi:hypothetical protein